MEYFQTSIPVKFTTRCNLKPPTFLRQICFINLCFLFFKVVHYLKYFITFGKHYINLSAKRKRNYFWLLTNRLMLLNACI